MGKSKSQIADGRADTDASLEAERVTSDGDDPGAAADARRLLNDLIDRDRAIADLKLFRFRLSIDRARSRERSDDSSLSDSVSHERESADQRTRAEREDADATLKSERQRSDIAVETDRSEHDASRTGLEARRQDTNDQLSSERHSTDSSLTVLKKTRSALADAQTKEGRHQDMLGTVAHELRGQLNVIFLMAESIAKMTAGASTRTAADAMECAASRMERLVNDLLDVVRIESGALRIDKQRHDVSALLLEVLRSYQPIFATRSIGFTVDMPGDSIGALFDYDLIVQVLSNLLGNAMKFTQSGGIVALQVERQAEMAAFTVHDNGSGIASSELPHVFERFWQSDSNVRRGFGLGLYICEKIIHAHGGQISAESELGAGATFRFTIPLG